MHALVLIGHGSLRKASGAAMIRLAALARQQELVPIASAAFLNFNRPTLFDAVERCVRKGASHIVVQPYFLIPGYYVTSALPKLVKEVAACFPEIQFSTGQPFGYHPALVAMVIERARLASSKDQRELALLLMAHGTPYPEANGALFDVAAAVRAQGAFRAVNVGFMELNEPSIPAALAELSAAANGIVAVPYFLQLGTHVAEDLPALLNKARSDYPGHSFDLGDYLSYDARFLELIGARVHEALELTSGYQLDRSRNAIA